MSSGPGIHFDPIGSLRLINGHLSVVIPVDISFIKPHIENINNIFETVRTLCKNNDIFEDTECQNLIQPLSTRYNDLTRDFEAISHLIATRTKRSAWFGGIGTAFKHLFGTMDENDAVRYNTAIQTVEVDQRKLAKFMKENILITSSTLSAFKDTVNKININEQSLNNAVESIASSISNLTKVSNNLALKSRFMEILNMLENSLLTLSFKVEDIINAVMFSKNNVLYPSIISPKQLFQDLVENLRFLPNFKLLPVSLDLENIHILINVSEMLSYYSNNKIVFILKIPLVSPQEFSLYHNLPLPIAHDMSKSDSYVTIIPTNKYIGITKDKSYFCNIDNLRDCKIINNLYYLCPMRIIYSSSANPTCESEMLSKVLTSIPKSCETKFLLGDIEIWQRLTNGRWIFVISQKSKISIDCPKENIYETSLMGTGILDLPSGCIGYCKETQLISRSNLEIKLHPINPKFELLNDSCCNSLKLESKKTEISAIKLRNIDLDSLKNNQNLMTKVVTNLDDIINKPHILEYGNYYSYTTIIIILSLLVYLSIKLYKSNRYCKYSIKHKPTTDVETISDNVPIQDLIPPPRLRTT